MFFKFLLLTTTIAFVCASPHPLLLPELNETEFKETFNGLNQIALKLWGRLRYSSYVPAELFLEANPKITNKDELKAAMQSKSINPIDPAKYIGQNFVDCVGMAGIAEKEVEAKFPKLKGVMMTFGTVHAASRFDFLLKKSAADKGVQGTFFFDVGKTAISAKTKTPVVVLMHGDNPIQNPYDVAINAKVIRTYRFNKNNEVVEKNAMGLDCRYKTTTLNVALRDITQRKAITALAGIMVFFFMERYERKAGSTKSYSNGIQYNSSLGEKKLVYLVHEDNEDNSLPSKAVIAEHSQMLKRLRVFIGNNEISSAPKLEASVEEIEDITEDVFGLFNGF